MDFKCPLSTTVNYAMPGQTVKFQFSRLIEYESQQEGIYLVYAMTVQGEIIDLSKYVTIEYSINEGNGIIGL